MIRVISCRPLSLIALAMAAPFLLHGADAVKPPPASVTPAAPSTPAPAGAPNIAGAEVVEIKGVMTGLTFKDCKNLTAADYQQIRKMESLKSLGFAHGPDDAALKILAGMPAIESFSTNGIQASDVGLAALASFPALTNLTFFHPGKDITGTGLAALTGLSHLEGLTMGGSTKFADPGMAAVAGLTHLKALRIWHTGATSEGVKALLALKELQSLTLGQQLDFKAKPTLNDDAVAVLAQIPSLEMLTLQEARLSLAALTKLKQLPKLKQLTLTGVDISDADLAALKEQLPKVDIKWTAPVDRRRIDALFGPLPGAPTAVAPTTVTPKQPAPPAK